jgi:hypothetical protein
VPSHHTWFEISNEGWKRMNAGRSLGHLVREAISNVFDAPGATSCRVTVEPGHVVVEDDSPQGIRDKGLITTVFMTDKEDSVVKRGRKGRGLKELISASERAVVETVGHAIQFNQDGTREEVSGGTQRGTRVEAWNKEWGDPAAHEAIEYLERFMPPEDISFILNGHRRTGTKILHRIKATLQTQHIVGGVQRDEYRQTEIFIRNRRDGEKTSSVYEMGIPICNLDMPWHADIQQRVPLNDNRDQVSDEYQRRMGAAVLDGIISEMSKRSLSDEWVLSAIRFANDNTQRQYAKMLTDGAKGMVIKSDSKNANDKAKQEGYELLDISNMPWAAQNVLSRFIVTSEALVKDIEKRTQPVSQDELREQYQEMVALFEHAAEQFTGEKHTVSFMQKPRSYTGKYKLATYTADTRTIRFNTLYNDFHFDKPLQPKLVGVFLHELGHFDEEEHDQRFQDAVERYAGLFAQLLWDKRTMVEGILGGRAAGAASGGKKISIACQWLDCTETRMIKPQDKFQVRFCVTHQKEHQRQRARQRRIHNGG